MPSIELEPLLSGASALGFSLTEGQQDQFRHYGELLLEWNERISLTAVRTAEGIVQRHFLDSVSCVLATGDLNGQRLIDVGTGAGLPGIPLKILFPEMKLTLVESVAKKARFLDIVVEALALVDVTVLAERAEDVGQLDGQREQYDWAVARAVAELRTLLEYLLPLCRIEGRALAMKGAAAKQEIEAATKAIEELGGQGAKLHPVTLPELAGELMLIEVAKVKPTPTQFPRRPGRPAKKPL